MRSRRLLLAALPALALAGPAFATAFTPGLPTALYADESVAVSDDARAMLFNPAGMGVRYPGELLTSFVRRDKAHEWNSTLGNAGCFGFLALRQRNVSQTYGLAFAGGGEKLRFGWSPYWMNDARTHEVAADHRLGLLSRPAPWLSMGGAIDHLVQQRFKGERRSRTYTLGLGVRPLAWARPVAHTWGTRLTLSSDVVLVDDGEWRQARVRTGAEWEALPGVSLRVMAADHRNLQFALTLRGIHWSASGGGTHAPGAGDGAVMAASIHAGEESTLLRPRSAQRIAEIHAGGSLADQAIGGMTITGYQSTVSSRPLHRKLQRALEDPLTRGVLLDLKGVSGMAQLEELRPRIEALRAAGKPVVADLEEGGGRGDLYLASACNQVFASEAAWFSGLGLRSERRYYKRMLADFGVRMDRSSIGVYKSAYRNYSVDATPAPDSIVIESLLTQQQAMFVNTVARGRGIAPERLERVLDGREWRSEELVRAGVIDSVGYREQAVSAIGRLTGLGAKPRLVALERLPRAKRAWTLPRRIAIVYAGGGIETGRDGNDLLTGPYMGHASVIASLERAFRAPDVRAVVLRIESPGGSSTAANLLDHAVQRLKRETGKPLIVSMGSLGASAAYYMACHADRIYADRHTRTGSIGVVFIKPSFQGFYAKHHVREDDFERGAYMSGTSQGRDWTPALQAAADSAIGRSYAEFVAHVADGRHLPLASVYERAQGRVWLGDEARARGLVDAIGGLEAAVVDARRRAGVPEGEKIRPLELGRTRPPFLARVLGGWVGGALGDAATVHAFEGARAEDGGVLEAVEE